MPQLRGGSWGVGGIRLPEFGVTEKIQSVFKPSSPVTAQGGSNLIGGTKAQVLGASTATPTTAAPITSSYNQPAGPAYGGPIAKVGSGAQAPAPQQSYTPQNNIQDQLNAGNNQIDLDYNSYVGELDAQANQYRGEAGAAEGAINTQADRARTQFAQEKASKEQGLTDYETAANKGYSSATQQARDLYRQVQQQNVAQLSAQGLSSSSVAEALAEKLGVETARRIATASGSLNDVVTNIEKERKGLGEFFQTKMTQLEQDVTSQIAGIRSQLLSGIDTLNRARNVAAGERANKRQSLLVDAQSAISQIQQQAQAYQQSLDMWKQQKDSGLADTAKDLPGIWERFNAQMQNVTQQYPGYDIAPQMKSDSYGNVIPTGTSVSKKKTDEDPTDALIRSLVGSGQ